MMRKDILKLIAEVQVLAVEVSEKTRHDVFTRFHGHTNNLEVSVCIDGWKKEKTKISLIDSYMDLDNNAEIKKELRRTKRELKKLLEDR